MLKNIYKKPLIIGSSISLLFFLTWMFVGNNTITEFIIGGMVIGFITSTNYKTWLNLGAISGISTGFIILILNSVLFLLQGRNEVLKTYETIFVIYFIIEIIISSLGGTLSSLIKSEYNK